MEEKKIIWITGASSGIGKALAIKFAENGWIVAASARRENLLNQLKQINQNIHPFPLDVTEIENCKLVAKKIQKSYFTKMMKSNVILGALLRKTQIRLIDSNKQSSELANEMSLLLDQLSSKQSSKKNILEERIKKIRTNISKMQQNIDI